ncbi:MAG: phospho-N-acetylmuramoyl-pentapeptide-transferase [Clostridia bacterium]|nr:phospho-N-acetylmuramoyl-pentapeptide-transferase [Clostridia bacterium]
MDNIHVFVVNFLISLILTVIFTKKLIPLIKSRKFGQRILEDGPNWHKPKEGTPTMGGIAFISAILICFLVNIFILDFSQSYKEFVCILNVLVYAVLNGAIGIIDDLAKIRNKRNQGLTPKMKFAFQSIVAILFLVSFKFTVGIDTSIRIPFIEGNIELGFFFYILAFFVLCGFVNAVNLSDGIDGLASALTFSVSLLFVFVGTIYDNTPITFLSASLLGAMLGFLLFNFHPAKIFMGDTGSLFLGAMVVSFSFLANNVLLVLLFGFVFLCEAMSVILQVAVYKITKGKRLFKMAPLHHHFEKCGWSEIKVVSVFFLINLIFCAFAYFLVI